MHMQSDACGCITTTSKLLMLMTGSYLNAWVAAVISPTLNPYTCVHMPRFGPGCRPTARGSKRRQRSFFTFAQATSSYRTQTATFVHVPQPHRFWLLSLLQCPYNTRIVFVRKWRTFVSYETSRSDVPTSLLCCRVSAPTSWAGTAA